MVQGHWFGSGGAEAPGLGVHLTSPETHVLSLLLGILAGVCPTQGGIQNLNKMVRHMTEKTPIISYWFYGCHCGLGGRGPPLDATDR